MPSLHQSFSWWCFANKGVEPEELLFGAAKIGYEAVDLIDEKFWPLAKKAGLRICGIMGHGTIEKGLNRPEHAARIKEELLANIAKAKEWNIPQLVCFSGNRDGVSDETGLIQCATTLKEIAPAAEAAGVTLCVELLNSRVDHSDYQCDHTAWGVQLCQRVGSPAVKLLYDIYHMQIMEGDLIRTIQRDHTWFSHYHTAGNPGRGEPDATQEIFYPPIYQAIAATGYEGFISHEFIPKEKPLEAMERVFRQCAEAVA